MRDNFKNLPHQKNKSEGFTLIEVLVGIFLVGAALIGLAHLFTYGVLNNYRADNLTNATFLAQQQIDNIRNLTAAEIDGLTSPIDETLDTNQDGTPDFRRVTQIEPYMNIRKIRVLVFPASQLGEDVSALTNNPIQHEVRADVSTTIGR